MDHTFADSHSTPIVLDGLHVTPRLSRMMGEIKSYGYRPTPAKLTGQQLLIAQRKSLEATEFMRVPRSGERNSTFDPM